MVIGPVGPATLPHSPAFFDGVVRDFLPQELAQRANGPTQSCCAPLQVKHIRWHTHTRPARRPGKETGSAEGSVSERSRRRALTEEVHGRGPPGHLVLPHDRSDVNAYRARRDRQLAGNLGCRLILREELQYFPFAAGEPPANVSREPPPARPRRGKGWRTPATRVRGIAASPVLTPYSASSELASSGRPYRTREAGRTTTAAVTIPDAVAAIALPVHSSSAAA